MIGQIGHPHITDDPDYNLEVSIHVPFPYYLWSFIDTSVKEFVNTFVVCGCDVWDLYMTHKTLFEKVGIDRTCAQTIQPQMSHEYIQLMSLRYTYPKPTLNCNHVPHSYIWGFQVHENGVWCWFYIYVVILGNLKKILNKKESLVKHAKFLRVLFANWIIVLPWNTNPSPLSSCMRVVANYLWIDLYNRASRCVCEVRAPKTNVGLTFIASPQLLGNMLADGPH